MKREDTKIPGKNNYVGETSRSLYERTKEHIRDGKNTGMSIMRERACHTSGLKLGRNSRTA